MNATANAWCLLCVLVFTSFHIGRANKELTLLRGYGFNAFADALLYSGLSDILLTLPISAMFAPSDKAFNEFFSIMGYSNITYTATVKDVPLDILHLVVMYHVTQSADISASRLYPWGPQGAYIETIFQGMYDMLVPDGEGVVAFIDDVDHPIYLSGSSSTPTKVVMYSITQVLVPREVEVQQRRRAKTSGT